METHEKLFVQLKREGIPSYSMSVIQLERATEILKSIIDGEAPPSIETKKVEKENENGHSI